MVKSDHDTLKCKINTKFFYIYEGGLACVWDLENFHWRPAKVNDNDNFSKGSSKKKKLRSDHPDVLN